MNDNHFGNGNDVDAVYHFRHSAFRQILGQLTLVLYIKIIIIFEVPHGRNFTGASQTSV